MSKVTVNLGDEVVAVLRDLAARRDTSLTDTLRRAIANEKFFQDELDQGSKILIEGRDRKTERVIFR